MSAFAPSGNVVRKTLNSMLKTMEMLKSDDVRNASSMSRVLAR